MKQLKTARRCTAALLLSAIFLLSPVFAASFNDVSKTASYAEAVEFLSGQGIIQGYGNGNFGPNNMVNRAEMAAFICRVLGLGDSLPKAAVFTDVPTSHWSNGYVAKAAELGIVNGYGNGRFGPNDGVLCQQAVTMLVRAIYGTAQANAAGGYPKGFLAVAKEKGLMENITAGNEQPLTRWEVATLLYNYYRVEGKLPGASVADGVYLLSPQCAPSRYLDVQDRSTKSAANIQIWETNNDTNQQFRLTADGNGYYTIASVKSGLPLDVAGSSTKAETNVQQYTSNGSDAQKWKLMDAGDGCYTIVSKLDGKLCLDVKAGSDSNGANVQVYTANGSAAQKWKLTEVKAPASNGSARTFVSEVTKYQGLGYSKFKTAIEQRLGRSVSSGELHPGNWCADFISLCAEAAGVQNVIPAHSNSGGICDSAVAKGGHWLEAGESPQPGDLAFIEGTGGHVGVVVSVDAAHDRVDVVHGNWHATNGREGTVCGPDCSLSGCYGYSGVFSISSGRTKTSVGVDFRISNYVRPNWGSSSGTSQSQTASASTGHWGEWSAWTGTAVTASATRQVETRQTATGATRTEYRYGRFENKTDYHFCAQAAIAEAKAYGGDTSPYSLVWTDWSTTRTAAVEHWRVCYDRSHDHVYCIKNWNNEADAWQYEYWVNGKKYYWEDTRTVSATSKTEYRYRDWVKD